VKTSHPILGLIKSSPVIQERIPQSADFYIPRGYHHNLISIGRGNLWDPFETLERDTLDAPLGTYSWIVPAVMTAHSGYRKAGDGMGPRTNDNTGKVYASVFSAPHLTVSEQVRAIKRLRNHARLAIVVQVDEMHIEGWFPTATIKVGRKSFCDMAMALGANRSIRFKCQPYALPGGISFRTNLLNRVIFLDEKALEIMHRDAAIAPERRSGTPKSTKNSNNPKGKRRHRGRKSR